MCSIESQQYPQRHLFRNKEKPQQPDYLELLGYRIVLYLHSKKHTLFEKMDNVSFDIKVLDNVSFNSN